MPNAELERIHQVLRNLVRNFNVSTLTYVDKNDPWIGILAAAEFSICPTTNRLKSQSLVQLILGCDMILLIKHTVDWELIRQQNQTQINNDIIHKNKHIVDYDYKVGDDFMITNHTAYKYEMPYKGPSGITQCFTNGMIKLQCGATKITYNIRRIKPY